MVLTAAFLALAAGGVAACDAATDGDDDIGSYDTTTYSDSDGGSSDGGDVGDESGGDGSASDEDSDAPTVADPVGEVDESEADAGEAGAGEAGAGEEVFYCADDQGEIVDEDYCDTDDATTNYFLWHSPAYGRGLAPGTFLDGGERISAGDRAARRAFGLPAAGKVGNGVVKTNVVGRATGDSAGG
ncbi:hypothetical protein Ade02nite_03850 [Paractinoplanes deccanensis]|uniref:Uncharacterized protein n=1 Tax=Paractinoplanes deccanensis TaxID=113561 RepID=A0ABQ3XVH6_9ACTN|nr:hypothetical protein Ade02nite_03850 [Actinoplanes deccanensis]